MAQTLVGRKKEKDELMNLFHSTKAEFVAVYGRRRVGKTYLINNLFANDFAFKVTAVLNDNTKDQLGSFASALAEYSRGDITVPQDWFAAFDVLRSVLEESNRKRKVVFIDEMPWLDTRGSRFIPALEHFWNNWASAQDDIMLIVCGSAASWIVKKLFRSRGGLHNRITGRIELRPFTLSECLQYARHIGLPADHVSILEMFMTFGGIPYYLSLLNKNLSLAQNVSRLCFSPGGDLRDEFDNLYASLFKNAANHILVVNALGKKKVGLTREEIKKATGLQEGGALASTLDELEQSGFIRKYTPFARKKKGSLYQLVDHFTLFHIAFIKGSATDDPDYWMKKRETQAYRIWRGYAFERVCLSHIAQIRKAIGVAGIITNVESWRSEQSDPGAQIDLLIKRSDRVVTVCEMKYSDTEYAISKQQARDICYKRNAFIEETGTSCAVHVAMITPIGLARNAYFDVVQSVVTAEDLLTS